MYGGPKVSLEVMRQALKAYWAGVEKAPCIFKICNSKSRFYVTAEFSRGNFSRISRCVGNGREGICSYCKLNPGPKVYRPGWLSIIKYIEFIYCHCVCVCVCTVTELQKTCEREREREREVQHDYTPTEKKSSFEYFKEF